MRLVIRRLHEAVMAVCPIISLSIGSEGISSSVRFIPDPVATPAQITQAQAVIDAFDWSQAAHDAWENLRARTGAKVILSNRQSEGKLLRAAITVLLAEINTLRAAVVPPLPALTISQVRAAVESRIDSGTLD